MILSANAEATAFEVIRTIVKSHDFESDILSSTPLKGSTPTTAVRVIDKPMCWIIEKKNNSYIKLNYRFLKAVITDGIEYSIAKSGDNSYIRLPYASPDDIKRMDRVLILAFEAAYMENADRSYGCCFRFTECSDAKKCTHPDRIFAIGCMYRKNLEAGRIFYGKNKNI